MKKLLISQSRTLNLNDFEVFIIEKSTTLKGGGGIGGVITGSRTYGGRSYIDIQFDNGGYMCDEEVNQNTDGVAGGSDDAVGSRVENW